MSIMELLETLHAGFAGLFWLGVAIMLFGCLFVCFVLPLLPASLFGG